MKLVSIFNAMTVFLSSLKHDPSLDAKLSVGTMIPPSGHTIQRMTIVTGNLSPSIHDEKSIKTNAKSSVETSKRAAKSSSSLDSIVSNLHRFEAYCEDKIFEVYSAIKDFNNYNYEKNQEIQYLSYNEKRKSEIVKQSQEKKSLIQTKYNKMHEICLKVEFYRTRITRPSRPFLSNDLVYFPQPKKVPMLWYDMHNLETIIQQLFTPKLRARTYYDEKTHQLKMHRRLMNKIIRKRFLPLPEEYLKGKHTDANANANANEKHNHGNADIKKITHLKPTGVDLHIKKPTTIDHFNKDILEQYTYSLNKEIQQIIIYYVFKYYELEVQDGTRKVYHYTQLLRQKRSSGGSVKEIRDLELRLSNALKELQENTVEMERNRVIPELIGLYNAENEVHKLLKNTKYTTKLIGTHNKRVITAFNPSDSIQLMQNNGDAYLKRIDGSRYNDRKELSAVSSDSQAIRKNLDEPLHWDQNWMWDY